MEMVRTFEDIVKANEGLGTVDVKGKDYVLVPQRVKAFRKLYPQGFIITDILSAENGVVIMQAKAGYYRENGDAVTLGTGLAFEKQDSSFINKTSYIENCETSAIGRALGFLGLGIDAAICSAEELINAINNQDKSHTDKSSSKAQKPVETAKTPEERIPPKATVTMGNKVPEKDNPVSSYIRQEMQNMKDRYGAGFNFLKIRSELIKAGTLEDIASEKMTLEQAVSMIEAMYAECEKRKGA